MLACGRKTACFVFIKKGGGGEEWVVTEDGPAIVSKARVERSPPLVNLLSAGKVRPASSPTERGDDLRKCIHP
jgi:hypothetical protein